MKSPCRSYFGSRSKNHSSGQKGGERDRVDVHEAAEAIRQVIAFAQSLPHVTNNRRNAERWIWQRETQRAKSCQLTMSWEQEPRLSELLWTQPPVSSATSSCQTWDLSLIPLPRPGANAYRPPMLCKQPPHLNLVTRNSDSVTTHQNTTAATATCPNSEKSLDIPENFQENSGKFRKIFEECAADTPTLPLSQEQEVDLLEQISWEDWEEWKVGWGEWTPLRWKGLNMLQCLSFHLLVKTMSFQHSDS